MRKLGRSQTLDIYVTTSFFYSFVSALAFFVLMIEMAELFVNIVQYMQNEVKLTSILKLMIYNAPKCISWALPVAMLFAVSFTLGNMYYNRELIIVYGSGLSLFSFAFPVLVISIIISISFFYFEDMVVIPYSTKKNELSRVMLNYGEPRGFSDITIIGKDGEYIWNVNYYDRKNTTLNGITIIERNKEGKFVSRLNAQFAEWTGTHWKFMAVRRFFWKDSELVEELASQLDEPNFDENPDTFSTANREVSEMQYKEALKFINTLERSGLPVASQKAEVYKRFAIAFTPLLVSLLSLSLVGKFKKNILLMSLLSSLIIATIFYVFQMISMLLAHNEIINPVSGAFLPGSIFMLISLLILRFRHN